MDSFGKASQKSKGKSQKCFDPTSLRGDECYWPPQNAALSALLTFAF
jgi:hypothetical protein